MVHVNNSPHLWNSDLMTEDFCVDQGLSFATSFLTTTKPPPPDTSLSLPFYDTVVKGLKPL